MRYTIMLFMVANVASAAQNTIALSVIIILLQLPAKAST